MVTARRVVMAVGISHFSYIPPCLQSLPADRLTHSSVHRDCSIFRGRPVMVIGDGASAIDLTALLHESGAYVSVVARRKAIEFHNMPSASPRTIWQRLRNPSSGLGLGWKSRFYTDASALFRSSAEASREVASVSRPVLSSTARN